MRTVRPLVKVLRAVTGTQCVGPTRSGCVCSQVRRHHWLRPTSRDYRTCITTADDADRILRSPYPSVTVPDVAFAEFIFSRLKQYKDLPAIIDHLSGRQWTFQQLLDDTVRVASGLARMGLKCGDTLLLISFNCPEYPLLFLACAANGIILSTANPSYTAEELSRQLEMSESIGMVLGEGLVGVVEAALAMNPALKEKLKSRRVVIGKAEGYRPFTTLLEDDMKAFPENVSMRPAEDVLTLPYSSGTTGLPKGVMLTHTNVIANVLQIAGQTSGKPGKGKVLGVLPFYHIYGMVVSQWSTLHDGNAIVTLPRFQPQHFLSAVQTRQISVLHLVPPLVLFLAKDAAVPEFDISSVEKVVCGAAPMGEGISQEFSKRSDAVLMQAYGLTEASPVTHINLPPIKLGSIGHVASTTEAKVVDIETGRAVGAMETGELYVRGPQVMKGYLNNPDATRDTIQDGWLRTGDLCHYDEDGYFTITDRLKELIKYKGFQVAPAELEALLLTHPSVADAAVIGKPDLEAGELPTAFILPKPGVPFKQEDVMDFVKGKVAPHKRLRGGIHVVDAIPKTASGKILRRTLKQMMLQSQK